MHKENGSAFQRPTPLWRLLLIALGLLLPLARPAGLSAQATKTGQRPTAAPHVYLQDGKELRAAHFGEAAVLKHFNGGAAEPLALASADLDEDGFQDLAVAYATASGGALAIHRG